MTNSSTSRYSQRQWLGLGLAPLLAITVYFLLPDQQMGGSAAAVGSGLSQSGRAVAAVGIAMAVLWISEALPIPATALIPVALFPLVTGGTITIQSAAQPYADKLIFLFLGGFLIALAMQRWGLHRRIALYTILLVGTRPTRMVAGFMVASAFLSMWVSNTATVMVMLPIAMSVINLVRREVEKTGLAAITNDNDESSNFAICILLGTAYASSIGGIGTLIGTPPNGFLRGFLEETYGIEISFARWMLVGVPLVVVFLPITWLLLTRVIFPIKVSSIPGGRKLIRDELRSQGPASRAERAVLLIFLATALAWMSRDLLMKITLPSGARPLAGLTDAGIAMIAAVLLFAIPIYPKRKMFLLTWEQAVKLPWGILILFGGGLSLASALNATGVAEFIGRSVEGFDGLPVAILVLLVTTLIVFLTELTSNTATTATFLPILAAVAVGLGISPMLLIVPATIAASCAFMMPVATPPNAIVFGSGQITIPQMCKAGLWLNLIGIALLMLLTYAVIVPVLVATNS